MVDGRVVAEAAAEYASMTNVTTSSFNVKSDYGDKRKAAHNRLIDAMAKGREVIWSLPNGEQFAFSLKGSKDIKSCHSY